jgi:hypothetical protein
MNIRIEAEGLPPEFLNWTQFYYHLQLSWQDTERPIESLSNETHISFEARGYMEEVIQTYTIQIGLIRAQVGIELLEVLPSFVELAETERALLKSPAFRGPESFVTKLWPYVKRP